MMAFIRGGIASNTVIDIQRVGGLAQARKCGTVAEAGGIGASLCAGHSLGIATAAMLQLACSTPAYNGCIECTRHQPADELLVDSLLLRRRHDPSPPRPRHRRRNQPRSNRPIPGELKPRSMALRAVTGSDVRLITHG